MFTAWLETESPGLMQERAGERGVIWEDVSWSALTWLQQQSRAGVHAAGL
jgi:hypothetical protein